MATCMSMGGHQFISAVTKHIEDLNGGAGVRQLHFEVVIFCQKCGELRLVEPEKLKTE